MNLKMIMAFVADDKTDVVIDAARKAGCTGATVITSVRGEGLVPEKTFLGLDLSRPNAMWFCFWSRHQKPVKFLKPFQPPRISMMSRVPASPFKSKSRMLWV